ncbi:5-oxoprolinase/urea amidolyase family protein [Sinomonas susongensis]|uniref:5-oxoprolinase subunit B/C family protein n=1 Tax=Sinomonas susongensis TaxID=1324851 RepID=UPI001108C2A8|nr:5-oxoprolinase/urea amidolyase family protein [Sinomonas susongensis]
MTVKQTPAGPKPAEQAAQPQGPAHVPPTVVGIRPSGDRAILVELSSLDAVLSLQRQLDAEPVPGQCEVVAAATTVLVAADSPEALGAIVRRVRSLDLTSSGQREGELVVIETVYDGADLDEAAKLAGLSPEGLIAAHSGQVWNAAFGGFAPGFAYLAGDGVLDVPRRSSPRTAVPAGAVALAGTYSAVYPRQSPGGWQLIGSTSARMWDLERADPALIRPGDRVRFEPVRESARLSEAPVQAHDDAAGAAAGAETSSADLLVVATGMQCTIQDLGRPGLGALGVSAAGAMDRAALRRANRMAGNPETAAVLEVLFGGLALRAARDQVLAVTGARVPLRISRDETVGADDSGAAPSDVVRRPALDAPFALLAGETLTLGAPTAGLRSYVAVRGGLDGAEVLGSRSTDTLSGIGPEPLRPGSPLVVLPPRGTHVVGAPETPPGLPEGAAVLRVVPGPRHDWFTDASTEAFYSAEWTVTPQSNRVGLRLSGPQLERSRDGELKSEGTTLGSVQIPPNGQPVLFLADHPVTGGYPVIGVVVDADLDLAAQLPPGARVRFAAVTPPSQTFQPGMADARPALP